MPDRNSPSIIYVFFGLIASGKSTLAQAWANHLGLACYNSDLLRKELAGAAAPTGRKAGFEQGLYSRQATEKTYAALLSRAAVELDQGRSVVLDASYRCRADRQNLRDLAKKYGACVRFVLCSCPETELQLRLKKRARDPLAVSDGRWEIYLKQKSVFQGPDELAANQLLTLSTKAPVYELVDRLVKAFERT